MDPDRWEKVKQIVTQARNCESPVRESFLDKACGGDRVLRAEIESLLACDLENFLESPALNVVARQLAIEQQSTSNLLLTGRTLRHYRIIDQIGAGGMGVVYRAWDEHLQRDVAVKVLPAGSLSDVSARRRFKKEALALARLNHPNIEGIYDFDAQDGIDFLAMEYIAGSPLHKKLAAGRLAEKETIALGLQLAEGLTAAQAQGIVHRDLKPSNLLITPEGRLKILDFGLVKLLSEKSERTTDSLGLCGTLPYMSPEQLSGGPVDHRSDIYSAGTVLYEMATGRVPFQQSFSAALINDILNKQPPDPRVWCPEISPRLEEIILKCLEKDPENRYQSARELLVDFRRLSSPSLPSRPSVVPHRRIVRNLALLVSSLAGLAVLAFLASRWITPNALPPLPDYEPIQVTRTPGWQGEPAISPDGNEIIYTSNEHGNLDIYLTDIHGNSPRQLTNAPQNEFQASWYPDGNAIAFTSERGGSYEIWKLNLPGGGETRILSNGISPAISPDGQYVAFCRQVHPGGQFRIAVARLNNPEECRILTDDNSGVGHHEDPIWSPDGNEICYATRHGLWTVPLSGGKPHRLTTDTDYDLEPVWNSDGRRLYFSSFRGSTVALWLMPTTGGRPRRATTGTSFERHPSISTDGKRLAYGTYIEAQRPVLLDTRSGRRTPVPSGDMDFMADISADGTMLVFASNGSSAYDNIWIQDLVHGTLSGNTKRLTDNSDTASSPVISPDGRWIAYYRIIGEQRDIWIVPSDGVQQTQFTSDPAADTLPAWSPNGSQLAFVSERDVGRHIWVAAVKDGKPAGEPRRLTTGPLQCGAPAWSPNGSTIAFNGFMDGSYEVWVVDVDGRSPPRKITNGAVARRVAWDSTTGDILASASWDKNRVELWRISWPDGAKHLYSPPVDFGGINALGTFGVTRDGRLLVYTRSEDLSGHIWILEAKNRVF